MKIFVNGDSSYLCGRAKTEVFKYDDVMPRFKVRSSVHTIRKRYVWRQIIFKYGGKNRRFRKYPATFGWSNTIQKRYVWTQMFFKYTEEKIAVFENTQVRVDGQIRFKNATCGRRCFVNTEEKIAVFENTRPRVDEVLIQCTTACPTRLQSKTT